jgi:hypothetical protein
VSIDLTVSKELIEPFELKQLFSFWALWESLF